MAKQSDNVAGYMTQGLMFVRDIQLAVIFMEMLNAEWLTAFSASPVALVVQPVLCLSLLMLAALQIRQLYKAEKRPLSMYLAVLFGVTCALLSNVSTVGGILTVWAGMAFAAGPWIFLSSLSLALLMQAGFFLWRLGKALSCADPEERKQHIEAAIGHAVAGTQLAFCILATMFTIFFPISAPVSAVFSALVVSMVLGQMLWSVLPEDYKQSVKSWVGLGTGKDESHESEEPVVANGQDALPAAMKEPVHHTPGLSIFSSGTKVPAGKPTSALAPGMS